jgi:hypothetical protein
MFTTTRVTHAGLTGKEWLEAFSLQAVEQGDGGYIGITLTTGLVFVLTEYTGHHAKQLFTG